MFTMMEPLIQFQVPANYFDFYSIWKLTNYFGWNGKGTGAAYKIHDLFLQQVTYYTILNCNVSSFVREIFRNIINQGHTETWRQLCINYDRSLSPQHINKYLDKRSL